MCLARHLFKIVYSTKSHFKGTLYVGPCRLQFKSPLQDVQNVNDLKKEGLFKDCFYLVEQLQLFLHNRFLHSLVTEVNDYSLIK